MATKKKQEKFAEEEKTEENAYESGRLRIGGAWRNEDKNGNGYLVTPINAEQLANLIDFLQTCLAEGKNAKLITYTNGYRTEEKHPEFISYCYPVERKEKEDKK